MSYRELRGLKDGFSAIADLWRDTTDGGHIARNTPEGRRFYSGVYRVVSNQLEQSISRLAAFARDPQHSVALRRNAVEFLVSEALESPRADWQIRSSAFKALTTVFDHDQFVCFPADLIPRISAAPIQETDFASELLERQKERLVCKLENREPPYRRPLRAPAPRQRRLFENA